MNDLHDLLEVLSTPEHDLPLDGHALLAQGRRRVRRRRLVAAGCLSVVAAGAAGLAVVQWDDRSAGTVAVEPPSYADLDLTPLSTAEVKDRCAAQEKTVYGIDAFTIPDSFVNPPGTGDHQAARPWHVGTAVVVVPLEAGVPKVEDGTVCRVPESAAAPRPLTVTADPSQLAQICGDYLRIDLSGWQVLAADADGDSQDAVFRSGNGYITDCYAQNQAMTGLQGLAGVTEADRWHGANVCSPVRAGDIECFGDGRVDDHTATRVAITLPSGRVVERPATDGYWALAVRDDASTPTSDPFPVTAVR
jgi:hypothetical protein